MPSIKDSLNEVYSDQKFTTELQQQTLQLLHKNEKRKAIQWKPAIISAFSVVIVLLLVFTAQRQDEVLHISSSYAPYDADEAVLERFNEFRDIVKDGQLSDEERRQYISRSDWDVQLALETGTSIFYNRPEMTGNDVQHVNELLHYMYTFLYDRESIQQLPELTDVQTFRDILAFAPTFNEKLGTVIEESYVSSLEEKPLTKNAFLNLDWWWQLLIVSLFGVFVYLFVQNIRIDRKKFAGVLQILFLVGIGSMFFIKDKTFYSYDETAMMESVQIQLEQSQSSERVKEILAIAQFEDFRVALFQLTDDTLYVQIFSKDGNTYGRISYHNEDYVMQSALLNRHDEWQKIIGVQNSDTYSAFAFVDTALQEQYVIETNERAMLYLLTTPNESRTGYLSRYDENGDLLQ